MPRLPTHAGVRRASERHVAAGWNGPHDAFRGLGLRLSSDDRRLQLTVEPDHAVIIACRVPRSAGAGAALALADEVTALFRGRVLGQLRFQAPSVDLDGRDSDGFRAVVTLPIRRDAD